MLHCQGSRPRNPDSDAYKLPRVCACGTLTVRPLAAARRSHQSSTHAQSILSSVLFSLSSVACSLSGPWAADHGHRPVACACRPTMPPHPQHHPTPLHALNLSLLSPPCSPPVTSHHVAALTAAQHAGQPAAHDGQRLFREQLLQVLVRNCSTAEATTRAHPGAAKGVRARDGKAAGVGAGRSSSRVCRGI